MLQVRGRVRDAWVWRWLDEVSGTFICRPRVATKPDLRGHRDPLDRPGHRRERRRVLVGRSSSAAPPAGRGSDRLVLLHVEEGSALSTGWGFNYVMSYPFCRDLQERSRSSTAWSAVIHRTSMCRSDSKRAKFAPRLSPAPISACSACSRWLGRLIDRSDDVNPGGHPVVVLSAPCWQTHLAGDPDADRTEGDGQRLSDDGDRHRAQNLPAWIRSRFLRALDACDDGGAGRQSRLMLESIARSPRCMAACLRTLAARRHDRSSEGEPAALVPRHARGQITHAGFSEGHRGTAARVSVVDARSRIGGGRLSVPDGRCSVRCS